MVDWSAGDIARSALSVYSRCKPHLQEGRWTILAAIVLASEDTLHTISLGTGVKCLPADRLSLNGNDLHDSHAEVLARRGAIRWFMEEIQRCSPQFGVDSVWLERVSVGGRFRLREHVRAHLYISSLPCGDASTHFLACMPQDGFMAELKDSTAWPALSVNSPARGRDNYSLLGVLRTKPGRLDSPPTHSMSCSDKIALWNVVGIQGALLSFLMHPVYISNIVIGDVPPELRDSIPQECLRALHSRISHVSGLPQEFYVNKPTIQLTDLDFVHSRAVLPDNKLRGAWNESLCFRADVPQPVEYLINGLKRGVPPKHQHNPKYWPVLSKQSLFDLYCCAQLSANGTAVPETATFLDLKRGAVEYQRAKELVRGSTGPFSGWLRSPERLELFVRPVPESGP